MASANTLCQKLRNVKKAVVTGQDFYTDADGVNHIRIHTRPNIWHEDGWTSVAFFHYSREQKRAGENPLLNDFQICYSLKLYL